MIRPLKAALVEYALAAPPLAFVFDYNPQAVTRSRTIQLRSSSAPGVNRGNDFTLPTETARAALGVTVQPETFTLDILIDASDRLKDGDAIAETMGIEPELDTLRQMVEPKSQGPLGLQMLSSLGLGGSRAFQRNETASVLLLVWGTHILPVFLTSIRVDEKDFLPTLVPYRATVALGMQVIEGRNPFYQVEKVRQTVNAAINTGRTVASAIGGLF
jgi:hypothetical protein